MATFIANCSSIRFDRFALQKLTFLLMGCIMYADDLILISPTVGGLQSMLTVCTDYGHSFDIVFNAKKCMLMCVGKHYTATGISVFIDNVAHTKVTLFKYLGVSFVADRELNVDVSYMKRRFYSSCNSILCKSKLAPEPVKLQLIKSFCLPYLTYCIGALQLSETKLREWNVCCVILLTVVSNKDHICVI